MKNELGNFINCRYEDIMTNICSQQERWGEEELYVRETYQEVEEYTNELLENNWELIGQLY